jgi:F-type H+-transporting ATPase subunit gamma
LTERLAELNARINGIRQLGAVVNAMRGVAGARAQQARSQLRAVETHAATVGAAIGQALSLSLNQRSDGGGRRRGLALVLFCAEQGFVGGFNERIFTAVGSDLLTTQLFLVGTRGTAIAAERNVATAWTSAMPSHSLRIPKLADRIADALYARFATGAIDRLDAVFAQWRGGSGMQVVRRRLLPLDLTAFSRPTGKNAPLVNLAPETLLSELAADYVHAQLCDAALHAFAAENEARMEAMASAHREIERQLGALRATQRIVRQDEITAEILELAIGEAASRV